MVLLILIQSGGFAHGSFGASLELSQNAAGGNGFLVGPRA
jgi:hypothetical protein